MAARARSRAAKPPDRVRNQPRALAHITTLAAGSWKPLAQDIHIGADAGAIHTVIACSLPAGGTHIDTAPDLIGANPDDNVIGEAKPAALLTGLDTAGIGVRGN